MNVSLATVFATALVAAAGLIGPGQGGPDQTGHPPLNPESWHKLEGDVMSLDEAWGLRIKPRGVFQVPGGIGLLYNSKPPDPSEAGERGIARQQTGSLAFSRNLVDWEDYPGNPVLYEVQDWQGSDRAMPRAMLYDEPNEQWVVYFGDSMGDYPGIRAVGTAYSTDLVNWTYEPGPTLTIDDYAEAVPERIEATPEELEAEGRVYASWAIYHEGTYYMQISGSDRTGEDRTYGRVILAASDPAGPFERYEGFEGDFIPDTRPVYWDGVWYTVFPGQWDGERGFGLAMAPDLMGPYEESAKNPIFTVETTTRARPQLIRYDGVWAVLYCHQHDTQNMPLRIAIAHMKPGIIPPWTKPATEND